MSKRIGLFVEVLQRTRRALKRRAKADGTSQGKIVDHAVAAMPKTMPAPSVTINGRTARRGRDGVFKA